MEAVSKYKNCPVPPRKMRLLANLVRGLPVEDALNNLRFHRKKKYSRFLEKTILSGIANWQEKNQNMNIEESQLFVKNIWIDEGRKLKRIQPAAMGRAHRIIKRSNHISLVIDAPGTDVEQAEPDEAIEEEEATETEEENTTNEA
jgi:large subunit ribosomal protein L22